MPLILSFLIPLVDVDLRVAKIYFCSADFKTADGRLTFQVIEFGGEVQRRDYSYYPKQSVLS